MTGSSSFPEPGTPSRSTSFPAAHRRQAVYLTVFALLAFYLTTLCLNAQTGRVLGQYLERRWTTEQGLPGGQVYALAQTPDGYLWIGTESSLLRFDGVRFTPIHPTDPSLPPINHVLSLIVDSTGALWIKLQGSRLLRYADGRFTSISSPEQGELGLTAVGRSTSGGVLTAGIVHGVMDVTATGQKRVPLTTDSIVLSIAQTPDSRIWLGTRESGLFWGQPAPTQTADQTTSQPAIPTHRILTGIPDAKINCIAPAPNGRIWIGTDNGIALWDGAAATPITLPPGFDHLQVLTLVEDHRGNLWAGTARGLLRYNAAGVQWVPHTSHATSPAGDAVTALLEDREGDLWVGDGQTLERLRDSRLISYGDPEDPHDHFGPIYVDPHGRAWIAPLTGGLAWMRDGVFHPIALDGLDQDIVYSLDGHGDDLWIGRRKGGLTHLQATGDTFTASTWTHAQGLAQDSVYAVRAMPDGSVWAGTLTGGVSHLVAGTIANFTLADGLASNAILAIEADRDGTLWFGTPEGLTALPVAGHFQTLAGLGTANVLALLADTDTPNAPAGLWIGTAKGLFYESLGHLRWFPSPTPPAGAILGLALDRKGLLWLSTPTYILSASRDALLAPHLSPEAFRSYGPQDGLQGTSGVRRSRSVVTDSSGRVWIVTDKGLSASFLDADDHTVPALAHIERVFSDGVPRDVLGEMHISPGTRRISFEYSGVDLRAPERVRFRYRLDPFDKTWSEPRQTRQAEYTNLPPGQYRFSVMAANSDGDWNPLEATTILHVEPLFWQRRDFQFIALATLLLLAIWIYRTRMRSLVSQANIRFEERLVERTRIARELHDTLLQGFISASLYLNITVDKVPEGSPIRTSLQHVLHVMERVIDEARNAVKGLRTFDGAHPNLEQTFRELVAEMSEEEAAAYKVEIEGETRPLRPAVYEDICRIGSEAVINATRHADARHITLRLAYRPGHLSLTVADDGRGMDSVTAARGREGHFGLIGMRERAGRIGAQFRIESQPGQGTSVALSIPARIAFEEHHKPKNDTP